uniref:Uncharacterized protein n=1 Tax=Anguilla anguilla TaxID=7936 RepID=A0A0E9TJZ9_ANGAN
MGSVVYLAVCILHLSHCAYRRQRRTCYMYI